MKKLLISVAVLLSGHMWVQGRQPNIVYIMTDQHSANALSCTGNADVKTPNIDRLAHRGVRFENTYCAHPLSGPSRASMFTGYMPKEIGMAENETPLPDSLRSSTLGSLMQRAGYDTGYSGKWHVNTNSLPADTAFGFKNLHGHNDIGLAEAAVEFMEKDHGGRPFFLVASFDNPHNICEYARGQKTPFASVPATTLEDCPNLPANFTVSPYEADVLQWEKSRSFRLYPTSGYSPDDWRRYRHAYFSLISAVDAEVGKIVDALDRNNLWDDTVVIFTSDHGDGQGAHQWNQKTALYEEVVNVPLVVCVPGRKNGGSTSQHLVNNGIDLMPTLLDWAEASIPSHCKGESFRKQAENPNTQPSDRDYVVTETNFAQTGGTYGWSVRSKRYKYVLYEAGKYREMLYDMENDRGEMRNLAVESKYADIVKQHREMLREYMNRHYLNEKYPSTRFIPVH